VLHLVNSLVDSFNRVFCFYINHFIFKISIWFFSGSLSLYWFSLLYFIKTIICIHFELMQVFISMLFELIDHSHNHFFEFCARIVLAILGVNFRTLRLLVIHSTTWTTLPTCFAWSYIFTHLFTCAYIVCTISPPYPQPLPSPPHPTPCFQAESALSSSLILLKRKFKQ
jgi:hypothetical protein